MSQPNVLMISVDSLRADAVSAIGSGPTTTPFLDDFAADSTLYTSAFAQGIWTVPSHMSVFTGLYPTEHGIYDEEAVSDGDISLGDHPTLGQRLDAAGYEMNSFFRLGWLGAAGILRGFPSDSESDDVTENTPGIVERIDALSSNVPIGRTLLRALYRGSFRGNMPDRKIVNGVTAAIESAQSPFCYFVHLNDAHWPYSPVKPFHNQFSDRSSLELFWNRAYAQSRMFPLDEGWTPSSKQVDIMNDLYLGTVRQVDDHLATLFDAIPDSTLAETIVVIFGDHGEAFSEQGELGHNDIIPSVAHVPLIIRDPTGRLPEGRITEPVQLSDIYETLGTLTDVSLPDTNSDDLTDGLSDGFAFTHHGVNGGDSSLMRKYSVWRSPSDYLISETVGDTFTHHGDTAGLEQALDVHVDELSRVPPTGATQMDDEAKQRLRELGYLD